MTTSPHRAEILYSSLEAFKKIQQERAKERVSGESGKSHSLPPTIDDTEKLNVHDTPELESKSRRKSGISEPNRSTSSRERRNIETVSSGKNSVQNSRVSLVNNPFSEPNASKLPPQGSFTPSVGAKTKKEQQDLQAKWIRMSFQKVKLLEKLMSLVTERGKRIRDIHNHGNQPMLGKRNGIGRKY